ncbi:ABC transporter substrate-binding protein [Acidaminobacter sp. JC074]|uniref:ABC transporter substrate-binding protein n=1 Tax=Acidaminobacter sp. JC074 TaxID=2530199 RepID=UPI001F0F9735|nr:ABC transporter substrate-binding protein [Acidaminobacter sp. JC074]MCH4888261.1 ABC transporter substrate-binding protein [Acidaminobacter sp. JC074]
MKRLFIFLMIAFMLVGCAQGGGNEVNEATNQAVETEEVVEETTEEVVETEEVAKRITTFVDTAGREVVVESKPQRVVCLYGSFADLWYEAGGELVGIIESSRLHEKAVDLPKVGKMSTPNIEAILALQPDLVIIRSGYAKQEELMPIFESNNIAVYEADYNNFDETMTTFENFCGMNENEELFVEKSTPLVEGITALTSETEEFSYLLLFASSKSISAKDDNISADILNNMGGKNIASDYQIANEETKQFSFEKILEIDPDYIFVQTMGSVEDAQARLEMDVTSNPAWASLTAVKEERFIYLPKELFLYKPNMRYLEAYEYIQGILEGN